MRPIKKKYFGDDNVNDGLTYSTAGGEGISSIAYTNRGTQYSAGITVTAAVSPIAGQQAVITPVTVFANGAIDTATINTAGTGYLTAPALTIAKPGNVVVTATNDAFWQDGSNLRLSSTTGLFVGMYANIGGATTVRITNIYGDGNIRGSNTYGNVSTGTVVTFGDTGRNGSLTAVLASPSVTANTIQGNAWTISGTSGTKADINKQEGARLYRASNANDLYGLVKLVPTGTNGVDSPTIAAVTAAGGPTAIGEMTIEATDHLSGTYWVTKLSGRTAVVVSGGTGTPGTYWSDYSKVSWTSTGVADASTVKIATND